MKKKIEISKERVELAMSTCRRGPIPYVALLLGINRSVIDCLIEKKQIVRIPLQGWPNDDYENVFGVWTRDVLDKLKITFEPKSEKQSFDPSYIFCISRVWLRDTCQNTGWLQDACTHRGATDDIDGLEKCLREHDEYYLSRQQELNKKIKEIVKSKIIEFENSYPKKEKLKPQNNQVEVPNGSVN